MNWKADLSLFQAIVSKAIGDTLTNTSELFTIHHTHSSAHCILNYIPLMTEKYRWRRKRLFLSTSICKKKKMVFHEQQHNIKRNRKNNPFFLFHRPTRPSPSLTLPFVCWPVSWRHVAFGDLFPSPFISRLVGQAHKNENDNAKCCNVYLILLLLHLLCKLV